MSAAKVLDWLGSLEPPKHSGLSDEGAKEALQAALHPITEFLKTNPTPQCRFRRATMVASRTVFTAPLEWVALLLAGGCQVTLKRPAEALTIWDEWVKTAHALPLHVTTARKPIADAELLVAMGSDETIQTLKGTCSTNTTFMGFGHKFSCVLVTPESTVPDTAIPKGFTDVWGRIAADIAMYDTRGCMSPSLVFTTHPLDLAMQSLSAAMARAEARWPRGEISAYEGAKIRERIVLGKTVGCVEHGQNYAVIGVPMSFATLSALPRCIHVVHVEHIEPFLSFVQEHAAHLSTIGTNLSATAQLHRAGPKTRICALGRMQRPHIQRLHDGVDWVKELFEAH